ncbi:hypothetical protein [Sphingomonas trueperi]|uniref:hypothetical protein n=1 Tax=Sphingomonas trueperi TaxID=53317 RepID=UPI000EACAAFB
MNVSVIVGLVLTSFSSIVLLAGVFSGNMFWVSGTFEPEYDTSRATAPGCFWVVTWFWILLAALGAAIAVMSWGK